MNNNFYPKNKQTFYACLFFLITIFYSCNDDRKFLAIQAEKLKISYQGKQDFQYGDEFMVNDLLYFHDTLFLYKDLNKKNDTLFLPTQKYVGEFVSNKRSLYHHTSAIEVLLLISKYLRQKIDTSSIGIDDSRLFITGSLLIWSKGKEKIKLRYTKGYPLKFEEEK